MKRTVFLLCMTVILGGLQLSLASQAFAGGVVIITNKSVPPGTVDAETIKKIYSGHITKWADNQTIVVTVMEGANFHSDFLKEFVNKSESQFKTTWKKMVFTGKGSYPKTFEDMKSLIDYVAKTEGAIGYIQTTEIPDDVNVVK